MAGGIAAADPGADPAPDPKAAEDDPAAPPAAPAAPAPQAPGPPLAPATIAPPPHIPPPGDPAAVTWPVQADLDGLYFHLGPTVGVARRGGVTDTIVGGSASLLRLREHAGLSLVGARVAAARWSSVDGGRVSVDGMVGTWSPGVLIGVAGGPLLDLADLHRPRIGASATIWCYAGVVPYLRVGVIEASGGFVEAGLELPLPIWRHRR